MQYIRIARVHMRHTIHLHSALRNRSAMLASGVGEVRLDIPRATVADTGRYLCQASNVVNSATPHATALVVRREYIAVT